MSQHGTGKIAWTEIVGSMPFSDRRLANVARRHFEPNKFVAAGNQAKRALIRGLVDAVFDPHRALVDLEERIESRIRGSEEAKALESCIAKLWKLGEEGWRRAEGVAAGHLQMEWQGLAVQLAPLAVLERAGRTCFLYAYFRKCPVLTTDGVRALLAMVRRLGEQGGARADRVVVLDAFKDTFYEDADFGVGEAWVANRLAAVLGGFAEAWRLRRDAAAPQPAPLADAMVAAAALSRLVGGDGRNEGQLSFRLH